METVTDFIFLDCKITADGDCSHEIKRCLLLGRKVMTNLDSIFKSRDITLSTKVRLVKVMVSPVVMDGCEIWTIKKAERWRIDAFELWRRLLRVLWTLRRSNQSILKEIGPEYSLEGLMLRLKLQYFGHLMWRADSLEKTLMLGGIGGRRRRRWQRMRWHHWLSGHVFEQVPGDGYGQGSLACCSTWGPKESDMTEWLNKTKRLAKMEESLTWFQTILQSYSHQDSMVLVQKQKYRQMEQVRKPRDKPTHIWAPYLWQRRPKYTMDKRQSL